MPEKVVKNKVFEMKSTHKFRGDYLGSFDEHDNMDRQLPPGNHLDERIKQLKEQPLLQCKKCVQLTLKF